MIGYPGIQADELKIISLTLKKLLRNLLRLGGYTQWVRPGVHPVLYQQDTVGNHHEQRKTSFKHHKVRLNPPALGGLDGGRSMYLPAEWGPRTPETTLLGDSVTTTRRAGLGRVWKGFSEDQDERL